jgi:DeoR family glycerol-3-phosphate regulon repressor
VLEEAEQVVRSHGAVRLASVETEGSFAVRLQRHAEAKQKIAAAAAGFVAEGQTVFIDASTTGHYVARALADHQRLTVVTNAVGVATELGGRNGNRIMLAGGELDYEYRACFDAVALDYLAMFTPSLAILSVESIHLDHGFTDYHAGEAAVCRRMVAQSRRVLMAADASKFDRYGAIRVAGFDAVDILVTDAALAPGYEAVLAHAEVVRV